MILKNLIERLRNSHDLIFKLLLAIFSVFLIVQFFPSEATFKLNFQRSKPWLHESLYAPFEYAILKDENEYEREIELIKESQKPYYNFDFQVEEVQNSRLADKIGLLNFDSTTTSQMILAGQAVLKPIYEQGIIELATEHENVNEHFDLIVVKHKVAEDFELNQLHSITSAFNLAQKSIDTLSVAHKRELLTVVSNCLVYNVFIDRLTTNRVLEDKVSKVARTRGIVVKNEKIIDKGDVITDELYLKLNSLKKEYEIKVSGSKGYTLFKFGQYIIVAISVLVLVLFLNIFRKDVINQSNRAVFIFLIFILYTALASLPLHFQNLSIYALPFCILPIIVRAFYDPRLATFVLFTATALSGFIAPDGLEFVFTQTTTGVLAIFSMVNTRKRSQLISTAFIIFGSYSVCYLGIAIIEEGTLDNVDFSYFGWFALNAILTLLTYPLLYIFEKTFGFLSDVTLLELSDTNSTLLRELATKAPGTFQHSLQVANLCEEAIRAIGGNALLVRTGALYHDIGKMDEPQYFIENQHAGFNPHELIPPEESAQIIRKHVIRGIEMAKKNNIPDILIDFIRTHHGTSMIRYFLHKWTSLNAEHEVDETKFRYPGPLPYSKETAVLMMADSVEAASRSLKTYNEDSISELVERIINNQANEHQFIHADITFKDITSIKKIFKRMLINIYHVRIEYPTR